MASALVDALNSLRFAQADPSVFTLTSGTSVRKVKRECVHLYMVLEGEIEIRLSAPLHCLHVAEGNFLFVPSGADHEILADSAAEPVEIGCRQTTPEELPSYVIGDGIPVSRVVEVAIVMDDVRRKLVVRMLPEARYQPANGPLIMSLSPLTSIAGVEMAMQGLGATAVLGQLAQMLFVATVREALVRRNALDLRARTPHAAQIAQALRMLRDDIARPWSVSGLARAVGMSRAAFAAAFRSEVDEAPIQYLTGLRLLRADRLIRDGRHSFPEIASLVGYQSETSFIRAFKRYFGHTPGRRRAELPKRDG